MLRSSTSVIGGLYINEILVYMDLDLVRLWDLSGRDVIFGELYFGRLWIL